MPHLDREQGSFVRGASKPAKTSKRDARKRLRKLRSRALAMEEPLNDLGDQICALCLMSDGLFFMHREHEARALRAIAWSALRNADALKARWEKVVR